MKLLINDTVSITPDQSDQWLSWMKSTVIPLIKNDQSIESFRLTKIKGESDENGVTYACQFICSDEENYSGFINNFDPKLQREQLNRFRGNFGSFRSILEVLEEG